MASPFDLTVEMVAEEGMSVNQEGFQKLMREQKERARKAREALGDLGWAGVEFGKDVPATEFVGYENTEFTGAKVVALVVENEQAEELMPGVEAIVVLDKTAFLCGNGRAGGRSRRYRHRWRASLLLPCHGCTEEQGRQVYALRQDGGGYAEAGRHGSGADRSGAP